MSTIQTQRNLLSASATFGAAIAAHNDMSITLVAAAANLYLVAAVWASKEDKKSVADVRDMILQRCGAASFKRSSQYKIAALGLKVARHMVKTLGTGLTDKANATWLAIHAAAEEEVIPLYTTWIKANLATTITTLEMRFGVAKKTGAVQTDIVKATVKKIEKAMEEGTVTEATVNALIEALSNLLAKTEEQTEEQAIAA